MNPLDELSWEQRFWAAFDALCRMEVRADKAELRLLLTHNPAARDETMFVLPDDISKPITRRRRRKASTI